MSMSMVCYDLQDEVKNQEAADSLLQCAVDTGRRIQAYSGVYFNRHYECLQIIAGQVMNPETDCPEIRSGHTHNGGNAFWRCRVRREITPEGSSGLDMRLLVEPVSGGEALAVMNVMNADILPSFAPGEIIDLQVIAKPSRTYFYPDVKYYARMEGLQRFVPVEPAEDGQVWLRGTMPERTWFRCGIPGKTWGNTQRSLATCRLMTCFGDINVMIRAAEEDQIRPGRFLSALCTVQGDALIGEYEEGMVADAKNDLMALRYALSSGRVKRLLKVMADDCLLFFESGGRTAVGRENAAAALDSWYRQVRDRTEIRTFYGVTEDRGEICVTVRRGDGPEGTPLLYTVFADCDREGKIRTVRVYGSRGDRLREYRSWTEMEEEELTLKGIGAAMIRKEKAFADYMNRIGARDIVTLVFGSLLDEKAVLEYGTQRVEGADSVLEYLEDLSCAISSEAGFRAQPVFISKSRELSFNNNPADKEKAVAMISKLEKQTACYFVLKRNGREGRIGEIRGVNVAGYQDLIDYYGEWDPVPEKKTAILRRRTADE